MCWGYAFHTEIKPIMHVMIHSGTQNKTFGKVSHGEGSFENFPYNIFIWNVSDWIQDNL